MIYTDLTRKAMKIAYDAHQGQYDVGGVPYVFHPLHVAEQMPDEVTTCVALLHDVIEDTSVTMEQLIADFPKAITDAVGLLTHDPTEDYGAYVKKLSKNSIAKTVKIADLAHNCDESRLPETVSFQLVAHWRKKYALARDILQKETQEEAQKEAQDLIQEVILV